MKKGVSPLIATILILAFVVVLASSIIIWGTNYIKSLQVSMQEQALRSITCTGDVGIMIKYACLEGGIGVKLLVENYGIKNIESFNVRVYGDKGASSNRIPQRLEAQGIKLLTTSYDSEQTGTVEKVELIPTIIYKGEEVTCGNINERTADFSGCQLSELQILSCEEADKGDTCDKLADIGLVSQEECCEIVQKCC